MILMQLRLKFGLYANVELTSGCMYGNNILQNDKKCWFLDSYMYNAKFVYKWMLISEYAYFDLQI